MNGLPAELEALLAAEVGEVAMLQRVSAQNTFQAILLFRIKII